MGKQSKFAFGVTMADGAADQDEQRGLIFAAAMKPH